MREETLVFQPQTQMTLHGLPEKLRSRPSSIAEHSENIYHFISNQWFIITCQTSIQIWVFIHAQKNCSRCTILKGVYYSWILWNEKSKGGLCNEMKLWGEDFVILKIRGVHSVMIIPQVAWEASPQVVILIASHRRKIIGQLLN